MGIMTRIWGSLTRLCVAVEGLANTVEAVDGELRQRLGPQVEEREALPKAIAAATEEMATDNDSEAPKKPRKR